MRGAGTSAQEEYRRRVSMRRLVRLAAAGAGLAAVGSGAAIASGVAPGSGVATGATPPVLGLVVAGAALIAAAVRAFGGADVERWYRGAVGERATAALLSSLPDRRWSVHHDLAVPGSRANIDHVAIGPTGVWVIDTKTSRAPVRTGWGKVWLGSRRLDTSGCRWQAEVVGDRLGIAPGPVWWAGGGDAAGRADRASRWPT